jgi:hypothetical protein
MPYTKYAMNSTRRVLINKLINTVDGITVVPAVTNKPLITQRNASKKLCSLYLFIAFINQLFLESVLVA